MLTEKNIRRAVLAAWVMSFIALQGYCLTVQQLTDKVALGKIITLDRQTRGATFVFVDPGFAREIKHNKVILLKPIGDNLRINIDEYLHKGHSGPLYIILPERYAGPKEKFILKSFPGYHGWYGSMLTNNYVMYNAK